MSDRAATLGPAPMDPPATPGPSQSAREKSTPVPVTPGGPLRTLPPATPRAAHSPFPTRTPRTPGGSSVQACTVDESKYSRVTVHTAKCTECDKRNMDTMRRCPGCTFQVCQPCYERREKQGRGLVHGNMATPGDVSGPAAGAVSSGRAVRKRPVASTPGGKMSEKKGEEAKKEDGEEEEASKSKEKMRVTKPAAGKKRAVKKPKAQESEADEASSEDEFDPGNTSPTPSKRRGAKSLTFAESALATATRTPPATRASRKFAQTYRAPSLSSESVDPQTSPPHQLSNLEPTDLLYQFGVKGYDEPLLGRREPVMSSPVALLPKSMDPSATPRATADEHYQKIQAKTLEKLQARQKGNLAMAQEQAMNEIPAQRNKDEDDGYPHTVRAYVESEAAKHHDAAMDEDDNRALFNAMEGAALMWGKQTYNKLDPATQRMVQSGLKMRLDRIHVAYKVELGLVLTECATRVFKKLVGEDSLERQLEQG